MPTFAVDDASAMCFDSMVAELIEYRLASYVLNKDKSMTRSWTCRLDICRRSPGHSSRPTAASGFAFWPSDLHRRRRRVHSLIRQRHIGIRSARRSIGQCIAWACYEAGLARLRVTRVPHTLSSSNRSIAACSCDQLLRASDEVEIDYVPLFSDYTVACGPDAQTSWSDHAATEIADQATFRP